MFAEETRGSNSPILIEAKKGDGMDNMMIMSVMIILVVFIFVIFAIFALKRHEGDNRHNGSTADLAGIAGLGIALNQANNRPTDQYAHDNMRDNLREFGDLKKEVALTSANTNAQTAQYFYATQNAINTASHENYKATKESEEKILAAVTAAEYNRLNNEISEARNRNLHYSITAQLMPRQQPLFSNIYASNEQALGY